MPVDAETTTTPDDISILTSDVSELVKELTTATDLAGLLYDALEAVEIYFRPVSDDEITQRDIPRPTAWMVDAFTRDLLDEIRQLASLTLKVRAAVNGGLDARDLDLAEVVGLERS